MWKYFERINIFYLFASSESVKRGILDDTFKINKKTQEVK